MAVEERTVDEETVWNNKNRLKFATTPLWETLSLPPEVPYEGHLKLSADAEQRRIVGSGALVPTHEDLPEFNVGVDTSPHGGSPTYKMSVGLPSDRLRATQEWNAGDVPTTTSTLESNLGPASLYYKTQEQPGSPGDMKSREFGGRLNAGPFSVGGSRMESSQETMPEEQRSRFEDPRYRFWKEMGWLGGKADILGGVGSLNLQKTWSRHRQPWHEGKHPPQTEAKLSYERALGPGTIKGAATGQMVRDVGKQYGANLSYLFPFLGGDASISSEFSGRQLPTAQYPTGQTSKWEVGGRWTKKF